MDDLPNFTNPLHGHCSPILFSRLHPACTSAKSVDSSIDVVDAYRGSTGWSHYSHPAAHVNTSIGNHSESKEHHFQDAKVFRQFLSDSNSSHFATRVFFISQKNNRSSLSISVDLLQTLTEHYSVTSLFLEMLHSFKERITRTANGYCPPLRSLVGQKTSELCYIYKYPERKPPHRTTNGREPWEIRHTGVYHRLDLETHQSVWIIISPMPLSLGEMRLRESLRSGASRSRIAQQPFLLHSVLISSYMSNWVEFGSYYELALEDLSAKVMTVDLKVDLDISQSTLRRVNVLKQKLLPMHSIFRSLELVLVGLQNSIHSISYKAEETSVLEGLLNLKNDCVAHSENSQYLLDFADRIQQMTSDVLNLKNQDIAQQQNSQLYSLAQVSASDSSSIRVITILTLVYLPFSFVATFLSMCFFEMDTEKQRIVVSPKVWIFFSVSMPLATFTVFLYRWISVRTLPTWGNTQITEKCVA